MTWDFKQGARRSHVLLARYSSQVHVNCNLARPFRIACGDGARSWLHTCTGSYPLSGVRGYGVNSNSRPQNWKKI